MRAVEALGFRDCVVFARRFRLAPVRRAECSQVHARKARATMSVFPKVESGARVHWLLLGSLALNLFFVGAAGAVAFRYSSPVPLTAVARIDHNLIGRLDRVADSLPPADADAMRTELSADAV